MRTCRKDILLGNANPPANSLPLCCLACMIGSGSILGSCTKSSGWHKGTKVQPFSSRKEQECCTVLPEFRCIRLGCGCLGLERA